MSFTGVLGLAVSLDVDLVGAVRWGDVADGGVEPDLVVVGDESTDDATRVTRVSVRGRAGDTSDP